MDAEGFLHRLFSVFAHPDISTAAMDTFPSYKPEQRAVKMGMHRPCLCVFFMPVPQGHRPQPEVGFRNMDLVITKLSRFPENDLPLLSFLIHIKNPIVVKTDRSGNICGIINLPRLFKIDISIYISPPNNTISFKMNITLYLDIPIGQYIFIISFDCYYTTVYKPQGRLYVDPAPCFCNNRVPCVSIIHSAVVVSVIVSLRIRTADERDGPVLVPVGEVQFGPFLSQNRHLFFDRVFRLVPAPVVMVSDHQCLSVQIHGHRFGSAVIDPCQLHVRIVPKGIAVFYDDMFPFGQLSALCQGAETPCVQFCLILPSPCLFVEGDGSCLRR